MPACPGCGAETQPEDHFCMSCGHTLPPAPEQSPSSPPASLGVDLLEAGIVCPACDTYNESTQRTCINCGREFRGVTNLFRPIDAASQPQLSPEPLPEPPPESAPKPSPELSPAPSPEPSSKAAAVAQSHPENTTFSPPPAPVISSPLAPSTRLHLLRGLRRTGEVFSLVAPRVTIGREGAMIAFPEDPFLAPIHLVLHLDHARLVAEDPGTYNGVFLRARGHVELKQGAEILVGSQRITLLGLGGPTSDLRTPASKDTKAYGSPIPRQLFLALRVLHSDPAVRARAGAVVLRSGPVVSIGQTDCSINFPDDPRCAARHVDLHLRPSSVIAAAVGSAGVFVRLHSATVLQQDDELIVGEELFRVETH